VVSAQEQVKCIRCASPLALAPTGDNQWAALFAWAALIFYPPAICLPMLRLERLGHSHQDSLLSGMMSLLSEGYWFVGGVVLLFSLILPPLKLAILLFLAHFATHTHTYHRAFLYRMLEWIGRWGMLDVMLVALLVAFVKLQGLVTIHAGPGLTAFTLMVLLSLIAGVVFSPHLLWTSSARTEKL